ANPLADFERLQEALRKKWGFTDLTIDFPTLQTLPQRLRSNVWKVKVFIWMEKEILDIQPGDTEDYYGLAVDIGTTTLAAYLCNLGNGRLAASDASINPHVAYGEDIMARITYSMMNPGEGIKRLRDSITEGVNGLIKNVIQAAGITAEQILELTVVGNTAMHHIFLGIDPQFIGVAPFPPAAHRSLDLKARDLDLMVHPAANVHVLPIEAGFVGADNVGVLISQVPYEQEEMMLIIDIGTNGELLLGNKHRLLSCSCATGPALEGGHLQFGMRAAPGAIEHVRIDRKTLDVRFQVIGQEKWNQESVPADLQARGICGSGIIEAIAEMFKAGILTASGRFNPDIRSPRLRGNEKGSAFVIARTEETAIGQEITISIGDARAVQLAKGALYSGAKVMMGILGVDKLDKVLLAGGFGSYIDGPSALLLGMFPDCDLNNIIAVGNAAGDGARLALLDRKKRAEADRLARQVEYIELTTQPNFMMTFVEAMAIPHFKDSFPHLKAAGLLP
ncbi:MAG: ASKHA domain-containing protein, partial [Deltaproteobacteria bacterium]|nr:ASKHA domain-containing protein [Deltaproteobacteria bacterium]